ncbi:MAG: hypothetical protein HY429_04605 [Candidatus Levybacteria bacterium]|nr:hypothetical protein [Candidatus Levybacteria bacterium]
MKRRHRKKYRPLIRAFSGLFVNLSAVWFAVAFITPNFSDITTPEGFFALTRNVLSGILFLLASA